MFSLSITRHIYTKIFNQTTPSISSSRLSKKLIMGKYTRPPKEVLVQHIISLRIEHGYSIDSIIKFLMTEYKYGKYYSFVLYNKAKRIIEELYTLTHKNTFEESIMIMENMLERALENQDNKLALLVIKELNKINNLYLQDVEESKLIDAFSIVINDMNC